MVKGNNTRSFSSVVSEVTKERHSRACLAQQWCVFFNGRSLTKILPELFFVVWLVSSKTAKFNHPQKFLPIRYCTFINYQRNSNFCRAMVVFWQHKLTGGACRGLVQARSGFGWQQVVLVVDRARDRTRAKEGAVAQGVIFDSNSSLACNKTSFRSSSLSPNAQSNSSSYKKFLMRSRRSDMTVEHFVYKKCLLQGSIVTIRQTLNKLDSSSNWIYTIQKPSAHQNSVLTMLKHTPQQYGAWVSKSHVPVDPRTRYLHVTIIQ